MTGSWFVDRKTEGIVTLLLNDGEKEFSASLPAWALPDVNEGDWLRVSFEHDADKKKEMTGAIDELMRDLL